MKKAPQKVVKKIKELARAGKVEIGKNPEDAKSLGEFFKAAKAGVQPDFAVTGAEIEQVWGRWRRGKRGNDGGFNVAWRTKSAGFGHATFYLKKGQLHCDNECMSREFLKSVMCALLEKTILDTGSLEEEVKKDESKRVRKRNSKKA